MKKRYLVTGGAGFIGYHLCKFLLEQDHEVVALDNFSRGKRDNDFEELFQHIHFIEADLTSPFPEYPESLMEFFIWRAL